MLRLFYRTLMRGPNDDQYFATDNFFAIIFCIHKTTPTLQDKAAAENGVLPTLSRIFTVLHIFHDSTSKHINPAIQDGMIGYLVI